MNDNNDNTMTADHDDDDDDDDVDNMITIATMITTTMTPFVSVPRPPSNVTFQIFSFSHRQFRQSHLHICITAP